MSDKAKKTINIVIIAIIVLLLVAFAVFFFFLKDDSEPDLGGRSGFPSFPTSTPTGGEPSEGTLPPSGSTSTPPTIPPLGVFKPILRQISATPVAGGIIFKKDNKQIVRYVDRAKGFVYETEAEKISPVKLTTNTILKVYEAYFKKDGSAVILRYLNDDSDQILTFYGNIERKSGSAESELKGNFLSSNINNLATAPSSNRIFYIVSSAGAMGILSALDGTGRFQIFDSPLSHWTALWPRENVAMVVSKPSGLDVGSAYFIDTVSGRMTPVLSGIPGLTVLPNPTTELVLYAKTSRSDFSLMLHNVKTVSDKEIYLKTLPEKCVWSEKTPDVVYCAVPSRISPATYPDDWYQGSVSFSDEIWKINTSTGTTEFIMNLEDNARSPFDAIEIKLNEDENFLHFINKENLSYWSLQIAP